MKAYFSRLILNPRSHQVQSELAHLYEMHRTLMRAFPVSPGGTGREKYGVLFRADTDGKLDRVVVYVQSAVKPDWEFLSTCGDYLLTELDQPNPACKDVSKTFQNLRKGQVLSFRLRANPTKRIGKVTKGDQDLKGKRIGLLREEEQIAWLIRKGQEREKDKPGGFEILAHEVKDLGGETHRIPRVNVRHEGKQRGRKKSEGKDLVHLAVRFDGLLRITDASAFRETISRGIGSGKAFGFGLLSLAPANNFGG